MRDATRTRARPEVAGIDRAAADAWIHPAIASRAFCPDAFDAPAGVDSGGLAAEGDGR